MSDTPPKISNFLSGPHSRFAELKMAFRVFREFLRGFRGLHFIGPCITVFGSARFKEGHRYYEMARAVSNQISKQLGFTILTGGGPGIMEAANRGAREAGGPSVIWINLSLFTTFLYEKCYWSNIPTPLLSCREDLAPWMSFLKRSPWYKPKKSPISPLSLWGWTITNP